MKKLIFPAIVIAVIITIMKIYNSVQATTQYMDSNEIIQTWEEFWESGVQIEYDETSIDDMKK